MGLAVMDAAARPAVLPGAANVAQLCYGAQGSSAACIPVLCSCCLAKHSLWPLPLLLVGTWLFLADLDSIHLTGSRGMSGAGRLSHLASAAIKDIGRGARMTSGGSGSP